MSDPVVTVRGEVRRESPPDLVQLSLGVRCVGADAVMVRGQLTRGHEAIKAQVEQRAAAVRRLWSSGLSVSPQFSSRGRKISGYQGEVTVSVDFTDFDVLPEIIAVVNGIEGGFAYGPSWSLSQDHPLRSEVRVAAIADARNRASDYAAAVGGSLGAVLEISDVEPGGHGWYAQAKMMANDEESLNLEPQSQEVSGQVTVRFALLLSS